MIPIKFPVCAMKWTLKIGQDDKLRTGGASKRTAEVSPMPNKRKRHTPEFKAKVSLDAIKGMKTASELASQYQVQGTLQNYLPCGFSGG